MPERGERWNVWMRKCMKSEAAKPCQERGCRELSHSYGYYSEKAAFTGQTRDVRRRLCRRHAEDFAKKHGLKWEEKP